MLTKSFMDAEERHQRRFLKAKLYGDPDTLLPFSIELANEILEGAIKEKRGEKEVGLMKRTCTKCGHDKDRHFDKACHWRRHGANLGCYCDGYVPSKEEIINDTKLDLEDINELISERIKIFHDTKTDDLLKVIPPKEQAIQLRDLAQEIIDLHIGYHSHQIAKRIRKNSNLL